MFIFVLLFGYAFIAMAITLFKRWKARTYLNQNADLPATLTQSPYYLRVARGRTVPQMFSLWMHVLLLILPISTLAADAYNLDKPGVAHPMLALMFTAIALATIFFNAFWIFPQSINYAQQYAFKSRTASPLLKIEEVLGWVIWISYTAFAIYLFVRL